MMAGGAKKGPKRASRALALKSRGKKKKPQDRQLSGDKKMFNAFIKISL